jgi:ABC-type uncharacterized transport system auxiliary subunit
MKYFVLLSVSLLSMFICGCSILPEAQNTPVNYYELTPAKSIDTGYKIYVSECLVFGPYTDKMVFVSGGNQIKFGEYNRWAMSAAPLMRRYLTLALTPEKIITGESDLYIHCGIFRMDCDMVTKKAVLTLFFVVRKERDGENVFRKFYTESVPVKTEGVKAYSDAMNLAAEKIVKAFVKDIKKIK